MGWIAKGEEDCGKSLGSAISRVSSSKRFSSSRPSLMLARMLSRMVLASSAMRCMKDSFEEVFRCYRDFLLRPI